ncbi:MAG: SMC-Scp complex subunit ScpB [Ruminococcaceae bacterium]|nr:SMC-Scp complex subunit ScpB [Oscillospiraceae bacterium]
MAMNYNAAIEAMLFAAGEPVEAEKIATVLEMKSEKVVELITSLQQEYESRNSGICILKLGDSFQMCSAKAYLDVIRTLLELKKNTPLSQAALEVLAIVAYNQPVTKAFIEQVRGVDCSGVLRSLTEKALIEEKGRLDLPGRPLLYGSTENFLRCFGLESLDDLPELPEKEVPNDGSENQITLNEALEHNPTEE